MGYKNDSIMDSVYYIGTAGGLLYIPPKVPGQSDKEPTLIPWPYFNYLDKEDNTGQLPLA